MKRYWLSGFTLVEILVVIAIIGILSALFVPNLMSARQRARDTTRKSDLKQIQRALELYKSDQQYPNYPNSATFTLTPGSCWTSAGVGNSCAANATVYMPKIPGDPQSTTAYTYTSTSDGSNILQYTLCACLENQADKDGTSGVCAPGGPGLCSSNRKYVVNQP